jgi:pentatricopeptide repeat protein
MLFAACGERGLLAAGRAAHELYRASGLRDPHADTALINMYGRCGELEAARSVFADCMRRRPPPDVAMWTAYISAHAAHRNAAAALSLLRDMQRHGVRPNERTYAVALQACSHSGRLAEAQELMRELSIEGKPLLDDVLVGCMVDVLARAGQLAEAEAFLLRLSQLHPAALKALLSACRAHKDVPRAERVAEALIRHDPLDASAYVLLAHVYAAAGLTDKRDAVRRRMEQSGARKVPGRSWIEVGGRPHEFVAADTRRPEHSAITAKLGEMQQRLAAAGHVPDTTWVSKPLLSEAERIAAVGGHSEKLAIAFGLLHVPAGEPIRVTNSLRMCGDCHAAAKWISRLYARDIIVRDPSRFHHFRDGRCSCGDND